MTVRRRIDVAQIVGAVLGALAGWLVATYGPDFGLPTSRLVLWSAVAGSFLASWRGFAAAGARLVGREELSRPAGLLVALVAIILLFLLALLLAVLVGYLLHLFSR